ncbi:hypothetical protein ALC62_00471 [Cyphomyrmex costatus]|uniref:Uncharacterized protein n=1 Tax=Cyphomyrmex costatus TaxID=456900 RepID=A0A195D6I0_9HYME|nr:hypothetical protein ALC62_00471 [Cyphomyrmex costatus]
MNRPDGECSINVDAMPRPRPGSQDGTYAGQGTQKEEASRSVESPSILRAFRCLSAEQLQSRAFAIAIREREVREREQNAAWMVYTD